MVQCPECKATDLVLLSRRAGYPDEWKCSGCEWECDGWVYNQLERIAELEAENEKLRDRTVYLEGLLLKYGEHQPGCYWNETNDPDDCDCGWSEQRAALEPREAEE